jgi:hypothetical protein
VKLNELGLILSAGWRTEGILIRQQEVPAKEGEEKSDQHL